MIENIQQHLIPVDQPGQKQVDFRCAAVLVPLVKNEQDGHWQVIFTRRAEHLKHHPGQISFPGGGFEKQDRDLSHTAIRETGEEIGIRPEHIQLIGRLPQQRTISQYNVTPFVGTVAPEHQISLDTNEVAEVFRAPFAFVTAPTNQEKVVESINGKDYSFYVIRYKHYNIWGATAKILVNLSRRLTPDSAQ